jgi:hypothetical protein
LRTSTPWISAPICGPRRSTWTIVRPPAERLSQRTDPGCPRRPDVFLTALSHNPNDSDRAQLQTYKKPSTQCLLAKGYKSQ